MSKKSKLPDFKFSLSNQKSRILPYGDAKEATVKDFPVSKSIAGVLMNLKPGGLRELHWHANAAEWGFVISGNVRTTIIDPQGCYEENTFSAGDIWYFPKGHGHSIEGLEPDGTVFMLVFDNGAFSEFATFSITDWLSQTPLEIVSKNLQVSEKDLKNLPDKEVYIVKVSEKKVSKIQDSPPLSHKYRLLSQEPFRKTDGGTLWLASSKEFPISTNMTGGILELKPGALRELHWHPNTDEWLYLMEGKARLTVFASSGLSKIVKLKPGDVGFAPMGYGHSIENTGDKDCRFIIVFNGGNYEEISLSSWLSSNPDNLIAGNLNLPEETVNKFPKKQLFIVK